MFEDKHILHILYIMEIFFKALRKHDHKSHYQKWFFREPKVVLH